MTSLMAAEKCSKARMPTEAGKSTFLIAVVCQWRVRQLTVEFDCVQYFGFAETFLHVCGECDPQLPCNILLGNAPVGGYDRWRPGIDKGAARSHDIISKHRETE